MEAKMCTDDALMSNPPHFKWRFLRELRNGLLFLENMAFKAFCVLATVLIFIAMTSVVLSHPEPHPDADPGYYGYKNYYGYYSDYKNYYGKKIRRLLRTEVRKLLRILLGAERYCLIFESKSFGKCFYFSDHP